MKALILALPLALSAIDCKIELDVKCPLELECTGRHKIIYNHGEAKTESRFSKKATLEEKQYGLIWGDEINPLDHFTLIPHQGSRLLINGIEYKGAFEFSYSKKVINKVDVDLVVQSILEKGDFSHLNLEALKALACAIRTDICFEDKLFEASELDWDGPSMLFQYPKIAQAVVETKDIVMTLDERVFPTTFCKDSAGYVAGFNDIFRQNMPTPAGKTLPSSTSLEWKKQISKKEFSEKLKMNQLKNLSFYTDKKSSKVYAVKLEDSTGSKVLLVERFMQLVGLNSNDFKLESSKDHFIFTGKGEGLGVGLCLKTAQEMAEKGANFKDILSAHYPDIKITVFDK